MARAESHRKGAGQGVPRVPSVGDRSRRIRPAPPATVRRRRRSARPEQLKFICRDRKCWVRWTVTGPLLGDAGADAVGALRSPPPNATEPGSPVFELARLHTFAAMPRLRPPRVCRRTEIVYPASRTTLYKRSSSSCAVEMSLPSDSRESFSSPAVRIRGALLSTGSTLFVETLPGNSTAPRCSRRRVPPSCETV